MPAQGNALGFRNRTRRALKGRPIGGVWRVGPTYRWVAPSGLGLILARLPRALPWAGMACPFGAQKRSARRVDEHLKKMGAVWK